VVRLFRRETMRCINAFTPRDFYTTCRGNGYELFFERLDTLS
jgi:hypothetical protein